MRCKIERQRKKTEMHNLIPRIKNPFRDLNEIYDSAVKQIKRQRRKEKTIKRDPKKVSIKRS